MEILKNGGEAEALIDQILEVPGVEEVYVSDEELEGFLTAW